MRKTIIAIVAFLLLGLVFSCRQHQYPHILMTADSLCEVQPDSALSLLRRLRPQFASGNKADQMYYQLLCVKANDKNFIPHESDSTILSLVDYYKTKGDKKRLTEAYFYAGSVYRDLNDAPEQMKFMQLSLETMPDDYPIHKRMLTHYQIGRLFILQDLDEEAITSFREAIRLCKLTDDTVRLVHFLRDAAFAWERLNENDSAMNYCSMALDFSNQINNETLRDGVQMQLASYFNRQGYHKKALEMVRPIIQKPKEKQDISGYYAIASRIFEDNAKEDSLLVFYHVLLDKGNLLAKSLANQKLANYSLKAKDYDHAYQYLLDYNTLSDSINKMNAAEVVERMHSLYNYQLREKENQRLVLDNKNKMIVIIICVFIVLIAIAISAILWIDSRRKKAELEQGMLKLERLREEEQKLSDKTIAENKIKIEQLRNNISKLGSENISLKQQLENQLKMTLSVVKNAEELRSFKLQSETLLQNGDIRRIIDKHLREESPLKQCDWTIIETEINSLFTDFSNRISALLKMSEQEFHICLLIKANVKTNDIAILTARTKQAISNAKSRMYQKAFKTKGNAEEWDNVILGL